MVNISREWEENLVRPGCKDVLTPSKKMGGGTEDGAAMLILVRGGREGCVETMISLQMGDERMGGVERWKKGESDISNSATKKNQLISVDLYLQKEDKYQPILISVFQNLG